MDDKIRQNIMTPNQRPQMIYRPSFTISQGIKPYRSDIGMTRYTLNTENMVSPAVKKTMSGNINILKSANRNTPYSIPYDLTKGTPRGYISTPNPSFNSKTNIDTNKKSMESYRKDRLSTLKYLRLLFDNFGVVVIGSQEHRVFPAELDSEMTELEEQVRADKVSEQQQMHPFSGYSLTNNSGPMRTRYIDKTMLCSYPIGYDLLKNMADKSTYLPRDTRNGSMSTIRVYNNSTNDQMK